LKEICLFGPKIFAGKLLTGVELPKLEYILYGTYFTGSLDDFEPNITKQMAAAEKQVADYGEKLIEQKYGNMRLQKFVVVALGFEWVCFKRVM